MRKNRQGMTLLEIIIAVAVMVILMILIFVIIDPVEKIGEAKDARREIEAAAIKEAIEGYVLDSQALPSEFSNLVDRFPYRVVLNSGTYNSPVGCPEMIGYINTTTVSSLIPNYLATIPIEPDGTGYYLRKIGKDIIVEPCKTYSNGYDLDNGLVALWRMDNDWKDNTSVNNGTANGNATFTTTAKMGSRAGTFDGTGDYISVASNDSLKITEAVTLAAWVKTTDTAGGIIDRQNTSWSGYRLILESSGKVEFGVYGALDSCSFTELNSPGAVNDDEWHHVVGTYDGTNMIVYIDSVNVADNTQTCLSAENMTLTIGRQDAATDLAGIIDELAIWNRALSPAEVLFMYNLYTLQE